MSRLPVIHTVLVLLCAAALFVPFVAHAELIPQTQHSLVSSLAQLEEDKTVHLYADMYTPLSGAYLVYDKCAQELKIPDSEQAYLKQKFSDVTQAYIRAYQDAYVAKTDSAPPQSFLNDVVAVLTQRQQDAVNGVAEVLQAKGCHDGRLRMFVKYGEKLHKQDIEAANAKPVAPAQPYQ